MEEAPCGRRNNGLEIRSLGSFQPHLLLLVIQSKSHPPLGLFGGVTRVLFFGTSSSQLELPLTFPDFCHVCRPLYYFLCIIIPKNGSYFLLRFI